MLLQEICVIKINPANITLKELTNFQGFLIQKQVHTIFVLLEYYFFHLQKMTWWDLILHHQSLECFIFSALLNFLIDCRDKMFSTFRQSEELSTKKNIFSAIVVCINMMIAWGNETITAQAASSCLSALWAPQPAA